MYDFIKKQILKKKDIVKGMFEELISFVPTFLFKCWELSFSLYLLIIDLSYLLKDCSVTMNAPSSCDSNLSLFFSTLLSLTNLKVFNLNFSKSLHKLLLHWHLN